MAPGKERNCEDVRCVCVLSPNRQPRGGLPVLLLLHSPRERCQSEGSSDPLPGLQEATSASD